MKRKIKPEGFQFGWGLQWGRRFFFNLFSFLLFGFLVVLSLYQVKTTYYNSNLRTYFAFINRCVKFSTPNFRCDTI